MSEAHELAAYAAPVKPIHGVPHDAAASVAEAIALVAGDLAATERTLEEMLRSSVATIPAVAGHLAFAGGKRLRPLLTLLCARAAGYEHGARVVIAAAGELIHTATLLHDDVIDSGEFRRGRPAARLAFGNGLAVLTGDFCLARSLQAIARTGLPRASTTVADTITRMAEGEVAQLAACGDDTLDRYAMVVERKTAALIAWCTSVAGLVDPAYVDALSTYGRELGFAFQLADDVLDYQRVLAETGKDPGQDLRDGKMTLPLILACQSDPRLHARVRTALAAGPPLAEATARALVDAVMSSDAIARANAIATEHAQRAAIALAPLPASRAKSSLESLTEYVVRRSA
jgi:octaprenyl-diphosphate synthase